MKKIIKNKVYDTSTAREMGTCRNLFDYEESLYRKKTGEFFLHTSGGPYSQESIMPLTYDKAQEWAAIALTEEQYEGIFFGAVEEDTETEALTVRLPTALVIQVKRRTDKSGQMIKEAVAEALQQWLNTPDQNWDVESVDDKEQTGGTERKGREE